VLRNAYKILIGKLKGKRPLGSPTHRWEDKTRMDLREYGGKVCNRFSWLRIGTRDRLL
jgi:hypothetical protein